MISPASYITAWCNKFQISENDILGPCRRQDLAFARFFMWHSLHDYLEFSYQEIAKTFNRDHTSILYGTHRWREMLSVGDRAAKRITMVGGSALDGVKIIRNTNEQLPTDN